MKRIILYLLAFAIMLTSCTKTETVRPSGSSEITGTPSATSIELPNNYFNGETVSAAMPESAILGAFRMTKDEFLKAWSNGQIKFGACQKNSQTSIEWGSTLGQGKWGHCFDINGDICSQSDAGAVICIEGTTSPFNYKVYGIGKYYDYTGKTIQCRQVFQYTDELTNETIFVPWKVTIKKGDPVILGSSLDQSLGITYDKGAHTLKTTVGHIKPSAKELIDVDPYSSPAFAYIDGKIMLDTKGTELYFDANGKSSDKSNAALICFYDATEEDWCFKFTDNENIEGKSLHVSIAFVNEVTNFACVYNFVVSAFERTFAAFEGMFSMSQGVVFHGKMLSTSRQREYTFDLPEATYVALEQLAKQRGQSGVTLAQLVLGGYVTVCGPMATKEESTASPYGHWFDSNAKVCKEGASDAYSCFVITPNMANGHCLVTLKNVPGANKVGDNKMFQQTFHSTVLGIDIPVTYIISVE